MELTGLNRSFVKKGLEIIHNSENIGLRTLIQFLNINEKFSPYHFGFLIGPRINAGGRIGSSELGANLLTSKNISKCYDICESLNDFNEKRKLIEDEALKTAILQTYKYFANDEMISKQASVVVSGSWHQGVSGLIASRIKDIYNLPSVSISFCDNEEIGKASCRSIPKIDIGAAIFLAKQKNIIIDGGGHKMAAGFSILRNKVDDFRDFLNELFLEKLNKCNSHAILEYDSILEPQMLRASLFNDIKILEPFGPGNHEPKFVIKKLYVYSSKIFAQKHISCLLKSKENPSWAGIRGVFFGNAVKNSGQILLEAKKQEIDILASFSLKTWAGREYPELIITDISY